MEALDKIQKKIDIFLKKPNFRSAKTGDFLFISCYLLTFCMVYSAVVFILDLSMLILEYHRNGISTEDLISLYVGMTTPHPKTSGFGVVRMSPIVLRVVGYNTTFISSVLPSESE